jgi:hypothetical protein
VYLVTDKRLAPEISVISTNKTDHHDFAKLLLNVATYDALVNDKNKKFSLI